MYTPVNTSQCGVRGSTLHGHASMMKRNDCSKEKSLLCS